MNDEPHALAGAYAVHALPDDERRAFERHLTGCPACVAEVRDLRETAARLAVSVAEPPPATLRPRVLAAAQELHAVRLSPTEVTTWQVRKEEGDHPTVWHRDPTPKGDTIVIPPEIQIVPEPGAILLLRRRRRTRIMAGLTAVSAAAAVLLGVLTFQARRDLDDLARRDNAVMAVLSAPDVQAVSQPITGGGTGSAVLSRIRGRLVFTASGLPELPGTSVYELWLMGRDGPRSAGLLGTAPMLVSPQSGDDKLGLTVEPAGGSENPTTQPVMLAELPSA